MLLSNPYNPDDRVRNEALALCEAGYEVTILAWDRDCTRPEEEQSDGLLVRRARIQGGYKQGARQGGSLLQVWRWFGEQMGCLRPHVVHCHDVDTLPAGVWYAWRDKKARLLLDAHENYYMMKKPDVSEPVAWAIQMSEQLLTPRAHLVISPCEATAGHYRNMGARKAVVVGNWKDPESFRFPPEELARKRQELGIGDRQVVVYIGRLSAERMIVPLAQAVRERPSFFLIVGGYGEQTEELRFICAGVHNVHFPGYIPPREVPLLTAISDIVYYGFDPTHPFAPYNAPNKLYEALAAGKAMIATDIGGELSNVIRSTRCGLLLPRADVDTLSAALDTLSTGTLLAEMKERAAQAGRITYNWGVARQTLLTMYSDLLSSRRYAATP